MNIENLKEGVDLEFKNCENKLPRSFWETYSSFANTFGGTIILGIDEKNRSKDYGVSEPDKIIQDIWNNLNNPEKVSCNLLVEDDIKTVDYLGKTLIFVTVPRAGKTQKPVFINNNLNNGTYRRNGEGDYHCPLPEIKEMVRDASEFDEDSRTATNICIEELNNKSIEGFRNRLRSYRPDHPWLEAPKGEFLRLIGAVKKAEDGQLYPTCAGLVMFGEECSISSIFPNYHLDYLEYMDGPDWTDRFDTGEGTWSGNIYDFLIEVGRRLGLYAKHPLQIEGLDRITDTDILKAERELLLNALVHADYFGRGGIRVELHPDKFVVINPGLFRVPIGDAENGGISDPRNPTIMKMLKLIGIVENAGSGVRRVFDICKKYRLVQPCFEEKTDPIRSTAEIYFMPEDHDWDTETKIKRLMIDDGTITMDSISEKIGLSRSTVYRTIEIMKSKNEIARIGGKRGRWEVTGYQ